MTANDDPEKRLTLAFTLALGRPADRRRDEAVADVPRPLYEGVGEGEPSAKES